jgi:hypothetical protein
MHYSSIYSVSIVMVFIMFIYHLRGASIEEFVDIHFVTITL